MKDKIRIKIGGDPNSGFSIGQPVWLDDPAGNAPAGYDAIDVEVPTREWELPHCYQKVAELAAQGQTGTLAPRDLMQMGYNLGRVSEITGEGREIWDTTKGWVQDGDWEALSDWAASRGWELYIRGVG